MKKNPDAEPIEYKAGDEVVIYKNVYDNPLPCAWSEDANIYCANTGPHAIGLNAGYYPVCNHHLKTLFRVDKDYKPVLPAPKTLQ